MTASPVQSLIHAALAQSAKQKARELGFDLVGIAPATPTQHRAYVQEWLDSGKAGTMEYLARRFDERADPAAYFPGAVTAICVAMNYYTELKPVPEEERAHHGRIARYALGDDYHALIKSKLYDLADWLREQAPSCETRCGVDTVPVLERELAARAGIGWVGKNTCVIHPRIGSWILLGEVLTTLPLPVDEPATDHCGTCTRCLDACPTNAITEPYRIDASRCISYLTIEHRGAIDPSLHGPMGEWLYGCDICQDVCPHNRHAPPTTQAAFAPRFPTGSLDVREVMNWTDDDYHRSFRRTAMKRVKLPILKQTAAIVAKNLAGTSDSPAGVSATSVPSNP